MLQRIKNFSLSIYISQHVSAILESWLVSMAGRALKTTPLFSTRTCRAKLCSPLGRHSQVYLSNLFLVIIFSAQNAVNFLGGGEMPSNVVIPNIMISLMANVWGILLRKNTSPSSSRLDYYQINQYTRTQNSATVITKTLKIKSPKIPPLQNLPQRRDWLKR